MILPIVKYGDETLREKAVPVSFVSDEIRKLAADMLETMYKARGVGLAAEQVGRRERICVIDVPKDCEKEEYRESNEAAIQMPLVLINPEIIASEGTQRDNEGCLSFPKIGSPVTRANTVTVTFLDLAGMRQTVTVSGLLARAVQHETDHLNGVLFVDKLSQEQLLSIAGKLQRLKTATKRGK
ncbi:MAG: peptide deformylase [Kiritimatiellae bacterium]|nr:peptide deformylase [Kiritimatiellia bacterium]